MDYTALYDKTEVQIDLNKKDAQVDMKNCDKRKVVYGLIGIGVFVFIFAVILVGWLLLKPVTDYSMCNDAIHNYNTTSGENESQIDSTIACKRQFVKEMMIDAWSAYERYAWGHDELRPVNKSSNNYKFGKGLSIVASMSSLWTMGLKEEFERGKKWIETKLDFSTVDQDILVDEIITEYIGGLLSCYALTNEQLFINKALTIAQLVEPAFNTSTGLPYIWINFKKNKPSILPTMLTSYQLDFNYLSDASGKQKYRKQIEKIQNVLKEIKKPKNLYFKKINVETTTTKWGSTQSDLFEYTREFYTSLVKSYIQSNRLDVQSIEMYKEAMDAVEAVKMFEVSPGGLYYARGYYDNILYEIMSYSGCYLGAMLSLGASAMQRALALNSSIGDKAKVTQQNRINRHWHLAIQITRTCQLASDKTKTGLGPDSFFFDETHDPVASHSDFNLSPELAKSNFILWRLTHNEKYRDNAWQMAQAIHRHCRVESGGYAMIDDVNKVPTPKYDRQPPEFLSATLKYLYLTFTSDSVLSLDQFVFNIVGHPLPICGNNTMCILDSGTY